MTRRQRQGKGGKDHHGCKPGCFICHPEKHDAAGRHLTRQEVAVDAELDAFLDISSDVLQRLDIEELPARSDARLGRLIQRAVSSRAMTTDDTGTAFIPAPDAPDFDDGTEPVPPLTPQERASACLVEIEAALRRHRCNIMGVLLPPVQVGGSTSLVPCVQMTADWRLVAT